MDKNLDARLSLLAHLVVGCPSRPLRFAGIRYNHHGLCRGLHRVHRHHNHCHGHLLVRVAHYDFLGGVCTAVVVDDTVVDIAQMTQLVVELLLPPTVLVVVAFG